MPLNDFNDLFCIRGAEEVKRQILAAIPPSRMSWSDLCDDAADIVTRAIPEVVQIVDGLLPEHCKLVIASGSKSFKTWLTMALTLSLAHGAPFWGRKTLRKRVLYVNLELRKRTFDWRIQQVAKSLNLTIDRSQFVHLALRGLVGGLSVHEIVSRICKAAKDHKCEVIVLDTVAKLNTEGDENSSRDQTILFNEIDRLTTEASCAVIMNDHFSKGNQAEKDPLDAMRGSSAKGGDIDAAIILRRHEEENCFSVDVIQRELPPVDPFVIGWEYPLMHVREDLNHEDMKKPKSGKAETKKSPFIKLLSALREHDSGNPITVQQWAKKSRISVEKIQEYLPAMRQNGWIGTDGEGEAARKYLTEKGAVFLESES